MKNTVILAMAFVMAACGGGNGSGGAVSGLNHNQLAQAFVDKLNTSGKYSVTLAKTNTLKYDYIVIYDQATDSYNAVNIGSYDVNQDAAQYLETVGGTHTDLDVLPAHYETQTRTKYESKYDVTNIYGDYVGCSCYITIVEDVYIPTRYRDRRADITFENTASAPKDLEKFAALAQTAVIQSRAEKLSERLGLSVDRSQEVVRLSMAWERAGGKDLSAKDQDAFSQEMLGFSITDAKKALTESAQGSSASMDQLIDQAALVNQTSPENVRQIIGEITGQ